MWPADSKKNPRGASCGIPAKRAHFLPRFQGDSAPAVNSPKRDAFKTAEGICGCWRYGPLNAPGRAEPRSGAPFFTRLEEDHIAAANLTPASHLGMRPAGRAGPQRTPTDGDPLLLLFQVRFTHAHLTSPPSSSSSCSSWVLTGEEAPFPASESRSGQRASTCPQERLDTQPNFARTECSHAPAGWPCLPSLRHLPGVWIGSALGQGPLACGNQSIQKSLYTAFKHEVPKVVDRQ